MRTDDFRFLRSLTHPRVRCLAARDPPPCERRPLTRARCQNWRIYYDAGDAVQVFNSVWYPDAKYDLPVLGMDLLSFNHKRYLAMVDFQPLHEEEGDHARP